MKLVTIVNSSTLSLPYLINMHIQKVLMERILDRAIKCSLFQFSFILNYIHITKYILSFSFHSFQTIFPSLRTLYPFYCHMKFSDPKGPINVPSIKLLITQSPSSYGKFPYFLIFNVPKITHHPKNPLQPRCFTSSNICYAPQFWRILTKPKCFLKLSSFPKISLIIYNACVTTTFVMNNNQHLIDI